MLLIKVMFFQTVHLFVKKKKKKHFWGYLAINNITVCTLTLFNTAKGKFN